MPTPYYYFLLLCCLALLPDIAAAQTSDEKETDYYDRDVIFNARVVPVAYMDVVHTARVNYPDRPSEKQLISRATFYGGHLQAGACIDEQFSPMLSIGIEANRAGNFLMPIYADMSIDMTDNDVQPTVHAGLGYMGTFGRDGHRDGLTSMAGVGAKFYLVDHLSAFLGIDYRFIFTSNKFESRYGTTATGNHFQHQLGLRLAFIFS